MSDIYKRKKKEVVHYQKPIHTRVLNIVASVNQSIPNVENGSMSPWYIQIMFSLGLNVFPKKSHFEATCVLFYLQSNHHEHAIWSPQEGLLLREP